MEEYYVYCLINPITNRPFYVGKGHGDRMYYHEKLARRNRASNGNKHLMNTIKMILENGHSIIYGTIADNLSEQQAWDLEKETIESIGLDNLCNLQTGGAGGKLTGEAEERRIAAMKGINRSPETRKRISEARKGVPSKRRGIPRTEEEKKKISEAHKGKTHSEETKKKMSENRRGKSKSDEHRKKLADNLNNIRPKRGTVKWSEDAKKKHAERIKEWHRKRKGTV